MIYDQSLDITETTNLLKSFSFGSKKNKESTDQSFISISEQKLQRVLRLLLTQINTIQQVLDELQPKHTHTHTLLKPNHEMIYKNDDEISGVVPSEKK